MTNKMSYSLESLLNSDKFTIYEKDILKVVATNEILTLSEANKKIKEFLKRKVK